MTNIDQFESTFRSAAKEQFALQDVQINRILYICDEEKEIDAPFLAAAREFTGTAPNNE